MVFNATFNIYCIRYRIATNQNRGRDSCFAFFFFLSIFSQQTLLLGLGVKVSTMTFSAIFNICCIRTRIETHLNRCRGSWGFFWFFLSQFFYNCCFFFPNILIIGEQSEYYGVEIVMLYNIVYLIYCYCIISTLNLSPFILYNNQKYDIPKYVCR